MRVDTKVVLCEESPPKVYNKSTGNYEVGSAVKAVHYCNVSDLRAEQQRLLFGDVNIRAKTVRFNQKPNVSFDYVLIDDEPFDVVDYQEYRRKAVYVVRERL